MQFVRADDIAQEQWRLPHCTSQHLLHLCYCTPCFQNEDKIPPDVNESCRISVRRTVTVCHTFYIIRFNTDSQCICVFLHTSLPHIILKYNILTNQCETYFLSSSLCSVIVCCCNSVCPVSGGRALSFDCSAHEACFTWLIFLLNTVLTQIKQFHTNLLSLPWYLAVPQKFNDLLCLGQL